MQTQTHNDTKASTSGQQAGGTFSIEDQITSLTAQALNGNTVRNRHLALDLVVAARDAAIKHSTGLTDVIASLLVGSPLPPRSEFDEADVLPVETAACPLYWQQPAGTPTPESVDFGSIVDHLAHSPEYRAALDAALATIGNRDPFDIKNRACRIVDDSDTYSKRTRDLIDGLYNNGDDLDALTAAVIFAETEAGKAAQPRTAHAANADQVGRIEPETFADEETDSDEVLQLRERVTELEAEVDLWKRQPWDLKHSEPRGKPGRRRGDSEFDEILDPLQIKVMVEHIGENTTGPATAGAVLLLVEHLGRLAFDKRFNDLDMAISDIRKGLLSGSYMENHTAESLRVYTDQAAHGWIEFKITSDIRALTEDFENYTVRRRGAHLADN